MNLKEYEDVERFIWGIQEDLKILRGMITDLYEKYHSCDHKNVTKINNIQSCLDCGKSF